ncbi:GNAT family N-acetyltransferase, partial [Streptomyces sp. NPDC002690]
MTITMNPAGLTVLGADAPSLLDDWDRLAAAGSFYTGAPWLEFSDTDKIAEARYLVARTPRGPVAALTAHWSPRENNERYVPAEVLPSVLPATAPGALLLGGRRGYLSGPALDPSAGARESGEALGALLDAAAAWRPEAGGRWWWPYLTTRDATTVRTALAASGTAPVVGTHLLGADCAIEVTEGGLDAHVAGLATKQRRTNARRELRAFEESGLRVVRTTLAPHTDVLGPLLANVQQRYGHAHGPEQMTSLLRRQADRLEDDSVVFLALAPGDGLPVGFCLAYRHGRQLAVRVVGFDYDRLPGAAEYAQLAVYEPLRYCHEHGLTRLELGMESYEAKCRRGASARPLWALAPGPGQDGNGDPGEPPARGRFRARARDAPS